jgi:predicted DNA binding CopG/RHH family protein
MNNETVRNKTIQCRLSEDEYIIIDSKADKLGLSAGSYLRMICLSAKISVPIESEKFVYLLKVAEGLDYKNVKKYKIVQSRVSNDEYTEIEKKASSIGLPVKRYLRMVCLLANLEITLPL